MPEANTRAVKSVHIPMKAHHQLRRLQLRIAEETDETLALGELVVALITLGKDRPLDEIIAMVKESAAEVTKGE
jgi:hypothetical protein